MLAAALEGEDSTFLGRMVTGWFGIRDGVRRPVYSHVHDRQWRAEEHHT